MKHTNGLENIASCAIIVPAYNKAPYIDRTFENLSALAKQGYKTIIVDDASTDGTRSKIQQYAAAHPEIQALYMQSNGKKVGAQKYALENLPEGIDTVIMLDSDSFIKNPEAIPRVINGLNADRKLAGGVFKLEPEGKGFWKQFQDVEYAMASGFKRWTSQIGKLRCAAGAGAIYKRKPLEAALRSHTGEFIGDDFELTTIVQDKGHSMRYIPKVKVGTYVPETYKEKVLQLEKWLRGGWRVWADKTNELTKQLASTDRLSLTLGLELLAPATLSSTIYGIANAAHNLGFSKTYLASMAGWSALNAGIAKYGGADNKTIAKTVAFTPVWPVYAITTYLPAAIMAAGKLAKDRLFKRKKVAT